MCVEGVISGTRENLGNIPTIFTKRYLWDICYEISGVFTRKERIKSNSVLNKASVEHVMF